MYEYLKKNTNTLNNKGVKINMSELTLIDIKNIFDILNSKNNQQTILQLLDEEKNDKNLFSDKYFKEEIILENEDSLIYTKALEKIKKLRTDFETNNKTIITKKDTKISYINNENILKLKEDYENLIKNLEIFKDKLFSFNKKDFKTEVNDKNIIGMETKKGITPIYIDDKTKDKIEKKTYIGMTPIYV